MAVLGLFVEEKSFSALLVAESYRKFLVVGKVYNRGALDLEARSSSVALCIEADSLVLLVEVSNDLVKIGNPPDLSRKERSIRLYSLVIRILGLENEGCLRVLPFDGFNLV